MSSARVVSSTPAREVGRVAELSQDTQGRLRVATAADTVAAPSVFQTGQKAVTNTAGGTEIVSADGSRTFLDIANTSQTEALFIGAQGVTTSTGHRIAPGGSFTLDARLSTAAIYGIVATGPVTVTFARF